MNQGLRAVNQIIFLTAAAVAAVLLLCSCRATQTRDFDPYNSVNVRLHPEVYKACTRFCGQATAENPGTDLEPRLIWRNKKSFFCECEEMKSRGLMEEKLTGQVIASVVITRGAVVCQ